MRHLLIYTPVDMTAAITWMLLLVYVYDGYVTQQNATWRMAVIICRTTQMVVCFACMAIISMSRDSRVDKYVFAGLVIFCQLCTNFVSTIEYPGGEATISVPLEFLFGCWVYIYTGYPIFLTFAYGATVVVWELIFLPKRLTEGSYSDPVYVLNTRQQPVVSIVYLILMNVIGVVIQYRTFSVAMELLHAEKDGYSTQSQLPYLPDLEARATAALRQQWAQRYADSQSLIIQRTMSMDSMMSRGPSHHTIANSTTSDDTHTEAERGIRSKSTGFPSGRASQSQAFDHTKIVSLSTSPRRNSTPTISPEVLNVHAALVQWPPLLALRAQFAHLMTKNVSLVQSEQVASDISSYRRIGHLGTKSVNSKWGIFDRLVLSPVQVAGSPLPHNYNATNLTPHRASASREATDESLVHGKALDEGVAYRQRIAALSLAYDLAVQSLAEQGRRDFFDASFQSQPSDSDSGQQFLLVVQNYLKEDAATRRLVYEANATDNSNQLIPPPTSGEGQCANANDGRGGTGTISRAKRFLHRIFMPGAAGGQFAPRGREYTASSLGVSASEHFYPEDRQRSASGSSFHNAQRRTRSDVYSDHYRDSADNTSICRSCAGFKEYCFQTEIISFLRFSRFISDCASWHSRPHMPEQSQCRNRFVDRTYERWFSSWWRGMNASQRRSSTFIYILGLLCNLALMLVLEFEYHQKLLSSTEREGALVTFTIKLSVFISVEFILIALLWFKKPAKSSLWLFAVLPAIISSERLGFSFHHLVFALIDKSKFDFYVYGILVLNCILLPLSRFENSRLPIFLFLCSWLLANGLIIGLCWDDWLPNLDMFTRLNVVFAQVFLFFYYLFLRSQETCKRQLFCLAVLPYLIILRDVGGKKELDPSGSFGDGDSARAVSNEYEAYSSQPEKSSGGSEANGDSYAVTYVENGGSPRKRRRDDGKESPQQATKVHNDQSKSSGNRGAKANRSRGMIVDSGENPGSHTPSSQSIALVIPC